jgi:hypothetical protein
MATQSNFIMAVPSAERITDTKVKEPLKAKLPHNKSQKVISVCLKWRFDLKFKRARRNLRPKKGLRVSESPSHPATPRSRPQMLVSTSESESEMLVTSKHGRQILLSFLLPFRLRLPNFRPPEFFSSSPWEL